jgi:hypothetical protein
LYLSRDAYAGICACCSLFLCVKFEHSLKC